MTTPTVQPFSESPKRAKREAPAGFWNDGLDQQVGMLNLDWTTADSDGYSKFQIWWLM